MFQQCVPAGSTLWTNSEDEKLIFFVFLPENRLIFHVKFLLKAFFSGKNISDLLFADMFTQQARH